MGKQVEVGISWTSDSGRRIPGYNHGIADRKQTKESVETKPTRSNEMEMLAASLAHKRSNMTALGSLGLPSLPIFSLPNLSSMTILLASSKPQLLLFMMAFTLSLPCSSRPCLLSPPSTFSRRSKFELLKPASMSSSKLFWPRLM